MAKAGFLLWCVRATVVGWCGVFCSGFVKQKDKGYERVIEVARKETGVREEGAENCGRAVKGYLDDVGVRSPAPWCAAFVSHCFKVAGFPLPRTAWSPALFPKGRVVKDVKPGYVYGIHFPSLGRIAHCGIVERVQGDFVIGIEGNTNVAGSRDGDRVMRKLRHKRTIAKYADWL
ncbi:peptidoglycan-binding protein [Pedobacter ginsengisoli]|uniref:peptidoglycan-binding protein n=1 Tax=Pedobacter ginsengisoli TaxID=363852 RepID=UPI00254BCCFF|nr:peptidoglycan-binding protein [Pedobacter ginsengisoli]